MTNLPPQDVAAVLFDKDGTLFHFADTWDAWATDLLLRLSEGDPGMAMELGALIGYDFAEARFSSESVAIAGTPGEIVQALSPEMPAMSSEQILSVLNEEATQVPMTEAVPLQPLLSCLKQAELRLGVATNDAEVPAFAHLDAVGVRGAFDFVVGSDSGFGSKPEPGQLLAFCDHVKVRPERTVMVGDSTHDLIAGREAGMWTVAVLTGVAESDELLPFADIVVPDIGHLPRLLRIV